MSLNQIQSIEILKGASSTLYGSGAATGVINIILKKANKNKVSSSYEMYVGSNNSANEKSLGTFDINQNVSVNGTFDKFNYLVAFNATEVGGMSAAKSKTAATFESDKYYANNGLVKLGYKVTDKISLEAFFNFDDFTYTFDTGAYADSDKNDGDQKQLRFGFKSNFRYNRGEAYVLVSTNKVERNINQFNSFSNTLDAYFYRGKSFVIDAVNKFNFTNEKFQLISGINYQNHKNQTVTPFATIDEDVANFNTVDPYASLVYSSNTGFNANLGGRLNIHSEYGNHLVYNSSFSQVVLNNNKTIIKALASYSTAFIAPSLYQLYDGFAGNLDLKPESNKTLEIGFESSYENWLEFAAFFFDRKEENAIIFDNNTFKYANGTTNANGIETTTTIKTLENNLVFNVGYTYTNKDESSDFSDYIPKNKMVVGASLFSLNNTFINVVYKNVGSRTYFDRYGSFGTAGNYKTLPSYNLLDINANYKTNNKMATFFGSITNVFNADYEETLGFNTKGRNFKLGIRLEL